VLQSQGGEFYNNGKNVLEMKKTWWKDSCIIAKCVCITHVNFIVLQLHFL
jgi:hypothetical protein